MFSQTTSITISENVIVEFMPNDTKKCFLPQLCGVLAAEDKLDSEPILSQYSTYCFKKSLFIFFYRNRVNGPCSEYFNVVSAFLQ